MSPIPAMASSLSQVWTFRIFFSPRYISRQIRPYFSFFFPFLLFRLKFKLLTFLNFWIISFKLCILVVSFARRICSSSEVVIEDGEYLVTYFLLRETRRIVRDLWSRGIGSKFARCSKPSPGRHARIRASTFPRTGDRRSRTRACNTDLSPPRVGGEKTERLSAVGFSPYAHARPRSPPRQTCPQLRTTSSPR